MLKVVEVVLNPAVGLYEQCFSLEMVNLGLVMASRTCLER